MLHFKFKTLIKAVISFDINDRRQFDFLRQQFKTQNVASKFVKFQRFTVDPFTYAISPLGSYNIGLTDQICKKCEELKIQYDVEDELLKLIKPSLNIDTILDVPNKNIKYRWYQKQLLSSLLQNGRGVIISPTRSGKSLILARFMS